MADPELRIRGKFDESGITTGAEKAEASVDQLGADMQASATKAGAAFDRLAATDFGPKLERQSRAASFALVDLQEKIEAAKAKGAPVSPEAEAALKRYEAELEKVSVKLAKAKDLTGDLKERGKVGAEGMEQLRSYTGSLTGALQGLANTSSGTIGKLGALGLAVAAVYEGVKVSIGFFKEMDEQMKKHGFRLDEWIQKMGGAVGLLDNTSDAQARMGVSAQSAVGQQNRLQDALDRTLEPLGKLIPGVHDYIEAQKQAATVTDQMNSSLAKLSAIKGFDAKLFAQANAEELTKFADQIDRLPGAYSRLSEESRKLLEQAREFKQATDEARGALSKLETGVHDSSDALADLGKTFGNTDTLQGYGQALDEIRGRMKELQDLVRSGKLTDPQDIEEAAAALRALGKEHDAIAEKIKREASELKALTDLKTAPTLEVVTAALQQMTEKLGQAASEAQKLAGSDPSKAFLEFGHVAAENAGKIQELIDLAKRYGLEVPPSLLQAKDAAAAYGQELDRVKAAKERLKELGVQLTAQMEAETAAQLENRVATEESASAWEKLAAQQREAAAASREAALAEKDVAAAAREAAIAADEQAGSLENVTAAMRGLAHPVEPLKDSVFGANDAIKALLDQIDELVVGSPLAAQLTEWVNQFKAGRIDAEQFAAGLVEIRRAAAALGGQAEGLGDLDAVLNAIFGLLGRIKGEMSGGGPFAGFSAGTDQAIESVDRLESRMSDFWQGQKRAGEETARSIGKSIETSVQRLTDGVRSGMRGTMGAVTVSVTATNQLDPLAVRNRGRSYYEPPPDALTALADELRRGRF